VLTRHATLTRQATLTRRHVLASADALTQPDSTRPQYAPQLAGTWQICPVA